MAYEGIVFALITAVAFGVWTVFHNQASPYINPTFGAIVVSLTAVILGSLIIVPQLKGITLFTDQKGLIFVILAGLSAFFIDYFALKTYASGIPISVGGPIIIGGSVLIAAIIGIVALGESISLIKIAGISLVVAGAAILVSL